MSTLYKLVQLSYFGRLVYKFSGFKYFAYPEESPDYTIPKEYLDNDQQIIVDWEIDDPEFPRNWPAKIKGIVQIQMTILGFLLYMGGPIYTSAAPMIIEQFNTSHLVAILPLSVFIFGYGISQIFFSPMAEQHNIGRTPIYFYTGIIFTLLQIPCAMSTNITGLILSRFFSGIFASPPFCVGAASYTDVTHIAYVPPILAVWGISAFCGPSMGPIVGLGLLLSGWENIFWYMLAVVGGFTIILFFTSPETNHNTLIYWKAERLRRVTGNQNIVAQCELEDTSTFKMLYQVLTRCFEIMTIEPIVLLMDIYQAVCYGCVYLWFEAFPIAYGETYMFSRAAEAAAYNTINIGVIFGALLYIYITYHGFSVPVLEGKPIRPEVFLNTSIIGSILIVISMFLFGWTVNVKIHWIASLIGAVFFGAGSICVLQSNITYLAMLFPRYVASVLGGNGLCRSALGGAFPLFATSMYHNLATENFPVAWGSTILGIIFIFLGLVPVAFKKYGKRLSKLSKYAN